jgi:membrane protease YdiL (CAAX protease family)
MAVESVIYALLLWRLSKELGGLLDRLGIVLAEGRSHDEAIAQLLSYVGAGIYEEALFRLALFGGLLGLLRFIGVPKLIALCLAAVAAAAAFAAVHHLGPRGEPVDGYALVFRTVAGVFFTALLLCRGFGIAVGTHACYDILVGITVG